MIFTVWKEKGRLQTVRMLSRQTAQGPRWSLHAPDPPRRPRFSAAPRHTGAPLDGRMDPVLLPQTSPQGPGESLLLITTSDVLCPSLRTWSGSRSPGALTPLGAAAKPCCAKRSHRLRLLQPHSGAIVRSVEMLLQCKIVQRPRPLGQRGGWG